MPAPPIVIGQEFEMMSIWSGDGKITLFATVVDAAHNFTVRAENTGVAGVLIIFNAALTAPLRQFDISPGSNALIRLQDGVAIGLPYEQVAQRVSLQGGASFIAKAP